MPLDLNEVTEYVETHIHIFHEKRLASIKTLKLSNLIKKKNPYLFKAKNLDSASALVQAILDAHLSSQEETIFGDFLERLACFVCEKVYGGRKAPGEAIDLDFERDGKRYLVSIKSGPKWGNSSQQKKLKEEFQKAIRILHTSGGSKGASIECINGCCYGRERSHNGVYLKLCGQEFWSLISNDDNLYRDIVEPLGHKAPEKEEAFKKSYTEIRNRFEGQFVAEFCLPKGEINWPLIVQLTSAKRLPKVSKKPRATKK